MKTRSKRYKELKEKIEMKPYAIKEALDLVVVTDKQKFDESVEIALTLNVDTRHADQQLRGTLKLPNGGFKTTRVLVLSDDVSKEEFIGLGATYVGKEVYLEKIKGGWMDFDVMITQPKEMRDLAKLGRVLGPKGLMPNPKVGTVTQDLHQTLAEIISGRLEYRTDKGGILHVVIGKSSMDNKKLEENYDHFLSSIKRMRPATVKGDFIKSIYLSTTNSPSVQLEINK